MYLKKKVIMRNRVRVILLTEGECGKKEKKRKIIK